MDPLSRMVKNQIENRGIKNKDVLNALRKVKRHLFVPINSQDLAYEDHPLPIEKGQTLSQPYIVAYMTEHLNLSKRDRVLEIGTGSGYQTAILAEIVNGVYSVEAIESLADKAQKCLNSLGYKNVFIKWGNGHKGWVEQAPYDAIIVTAAPEKIPQALIDQLKIGGRMIIPVGTLFQELQLITKNDSGTAIEKLIPVRFVPMVDKTEN